MWDSIPGLWDHNLSQRRTLNHWATQVPLFYSFSIISSTLPAARLFHKEKKIKKWKEIHQGRKALEHSKNYQVGSQWALRITSFHWYQGPLLRKRHTMGTMAEHTEVWPVGEDKLCVFRWRLIRNLESLSHRSPGPLAVLALRATQQGLDVIKETIAPPHKYVSCLISSTWNWSTLQPTANTSNQIDISHGIHHVEWQLEASLKKMIPEDRDLASKQLANGLITRARKLITCHWNPRGVMYCVESFFSESCEWSLWKRKNKVPW